MIENTDDVTIDEPQMVPNRVQLPTVAMPTPPRMPPIQSLRVLKMLVLRLPAVARYPIAMNSGTVISA